MTGKAFLVGAGPGRADLISVRGLSLLRAADVVIYDRLIARELLQDTRPQAERIFVGKQGHRPSTMPQNEINALLVNRVRAGLHVVRLKGGDGFVFGRGGEECLALAAAGLPFEVVPGVSAAIAAPAYAGIPVTHRDLASAFVVVTGNEDPAKEETSVDWSQMAQLPTLVIMMGARRASSICAALLRHGRDPDSPAAAIGSATTRQQRVACSTLAGLPQAMARTQIHAPAVLVFGDVVTLRDRLDWFSPVKAAQVSSGWSGQSPSSQLGRSAARDPRQSTRQTGQESRTSLSPRCPARDSAPIDYLRPTCIRQATTQSRPSAAPNAPP